MSNRIPARTAKGRDVLLDRTIELDSKLRTVLAQCDGKRDEEQINARFGTIVDVAQAIEALLAQGLIEVPEIAQVATAASTSRPPVLAPTLLTPASAAVAPAVTPAFTVTSSTAPSTPVIPARPAVAPEVDPFAEWFPASMLAGTDKDRAA